jgi:hypothetical protein
MGETDTAEVGLRARGAVRRTKKKREAAARHDGMELGMI